MAASHLGVKLCSMSFTILFCQAAFKRIRIFTATLRSKYIINLNPSKLITMMPAKTWATKSKFHCLHFFPLTYELTFLGVLSMHSFPSFHSSVCFWHLFMLWEFSWCSVPCDILMRMDVPDFGNGSNSSSRV